MKRLLLIFVLAFTLVLSLTMISCEVSSDNQANNEYTLTFVFGDERPNEEMTESEGGEFKIPIPEREGYNFIGWCTDAELTNFFDLSSGVKGDTVLYAKWDIDYKLLMSEVSSKALLSCVKVVCCNSESSLFQSKTSQGSGIIYDYRDGYYYALTNNHVISKSVDSVYAKISVHDAYGNEYTARLEKRDSSCDLAVLKFAAKQSVQLHVSEISERIPDKNETLVSVSVPGGKYNTVELGSPIGYKAIDGGNQDGEISKVTCEVLWTDIKADNGSSGGGIFDTDMKLTALIFAVGKSSGGEQLYTFAIPGAKIIEFLNSSDS